MKRGPLFVLLSYVLWGVLPVFWKLLADVDSFYVLACRVVFSLAVSAALLAFVFAGADFEQLAHTLRAVRPGWLLLAGALLVAADLLMALKCWVLRRSMSVRGTILSYCRMRFFSLLPGGNITGEAARLMYLRNMTDGYVATTLMIIDKQTQMIPQQTLCLIGLALAGARGHWIFFGLSGFTLGWALLVPGSLFIPSARRAALRIAAWLGRLRFRWGAVAAEELRLLCGACESLADQRGTVLAHLLLGLASDLLLIGAQALIGHALGFSIALTDWLWINGIVSIAMCLPFSVEGGGTELPRHIQLKDSKTELKTADMLVCFGGDGTILHAAKEANAFGVPVLGVNLGSVGFMAELEQGELSMLSRLAAGKYTVESRMMLDVAVRRDGKVIFTDMALNDAVLTKGAVARVLELEVYADKALMVRFSADGVIVATPTGSTAYSMSAGGPIVEPTAENMIVTPICPHALSARSVVLGRERTVSLKMGRLARKTAYLSVDGGKAFRLSGGDTVEMRVSASRTKLARVTGRSFYGILGQKLGGAKA